MDHALDRLSSAAASPRIRSIETLRPLMWLRQGFEDLVRLRWASLGYGLAFAAFGVMLLALMWGATYMVPTYMGGFLLVAPFAAMGLYAMSEQLESRRSPDTAAALMAWRHNAGSIALFGLVLAMALVFWERLAAIVFALFYGGTVPALEQVLSEVFFSGRYLLLAAAFIGTGALLAAVVFSVSAITAPMLLDRPVDTVTAIITSMRCCVRNPGAMLLWAVLIATLMVIGFATAMLGMIVLFPWVGHASWHAYRDLVE